MTAISVSYPLIVQLCGDNPCLYMQSSAAGISVAEGVNISAPELDSLAYTPVIPLHS